MILMVKKIIIFVGPTDSAANGLQGGGMKARKRVSGEYTTVFSLYFFYIFLDTATASGIYTYDVIASPLSYIYTNIHVRIYTRAINLFKCYSEIISEHDRALRIYCVHTFKHTYIYMCERIQICRSLAIFRRVVPPIHVIPPPFAPARLPSYNVPQMVSNTHAR